LSADTFPEDVLELQHYLGPSAQLVRAVPGQGTNVPLYLLGSSTFSAQLAAELGLPFAFASHFAPDLMTTALEIYRSKFHPSSALAAPYVMIGVNVFAADTDEEAARLFTTLEQMILNLVRGHPREMPPPSDRIEWHPAEEAQVRRMTAISAVGSPATVRGKLEALLNATGANEAIVTAQIFDHAARLRSFEIAAEVFEDINSARIFSHSAPAVLATTHD
jgi:luciferase family oxidoreductase group 1